MGAPQRTSGTGLFTADVNGDGRLDLVTHGSVMTWWDLIPFDNPSGLPPELPVSLGSLDRALPMQFNTLGSTIDTEMALYGPEGKLLRENDNFSETAQSGIAIPPNLEEGTYYIAVGQHNTIFGGGFYTRAPSAAAADFLFNWGENRVGVPLAAESIQGALPADGVQWFSFEIGPIVTPEVALAEVWFADGSFNMSWQTDLGVRYRVQRSSDLQGWGNVGSVIPGNGNVLEHSQSVTNMREFFRVVIP